MDPRTLVTDIIASASRTGVEIVRGVLVIPIIIGALGTDAYGIWASTLSVVGIVSGIASFRLSDGLVRYMPAESNKDQVFVDFFVLATAAVAVVSGCFLALTFLIDVFPGIADDAGYRVSVAAVIVMYPLYEFTASQLRARGEIKRYELINTARTIVETVVLLIVFQAGRGLVSGFWTLSGVSLVFICIVLILRFPTSAGLPRVSRFPEYVRFSAPLVPMTISNRIVANADRYIVLLLLSPTAAGVYAVATSIARFVENLVQTVNPTLYPTLVEAWENNQWAEIKELYETVVRFTLLIFVPAAAGLFVVGDTLLRLLATPEVASSGRGLLPVLGLAFLTSGLVGLLQLSFNAAEMTDQNAKISIGVGVINIILNVILIGPLGLYGPAVATGVTFLIALRYLLNALPKQVAIGFPWMTVVRSGISTGIMAAVLLNVPLSLSPYIELLVVPVIGVAVYSGCVILSGEITAEDVRFFRHHLR